MNIKTAVFGVAVVGASLGGSLAVNHQSAEVAVVSAGKVEADDHVAAIATVDRRATEHVCLKSPINLDGVDTVGWLCDGAYLPNQQGWLDKVAGEDGAAVELRGVEDGAGKVVYNATVRKR